MLRIIHNSPAGGGGGTDDQTAAEVPVSASGFTGNLSPSDTDVQTALETLDAMAAGGDVTGPGSSTDTAVALWDGTTGDVLQDSAILESELETLTDGSNADALHIHNYGDVSGPGSSVDNRVALFDGTTGKLLKSGTSYETAGTWNVTGNIVLTTPSAQVDGVDVSAHATDVNAHHSQTHTLASHTQGSNKIFMTNGSVFTEIALGTSGTYLKSQGVGMDLTWDTPAGGGGAPTDAEYVVLSTDSTLTDERVLTAGSGITITDAGAGSTVTVGITDMPTDRIRGRVSAGSGAVENLTPASVLSMIGAAPVGSKYVIIGPVDGTLTDERLLNTSSTITYVDGGPGSTVTLSVVDFSIDSTQLAAYGVTNGKLATIAEARLKGRAYGAGTGDATDLTAAQSRKILIEPYTVISYAVSITPNASAASKFSTTLSGNTTLHKPTNLISGQTIEYRFKQDSTGGRSVTFDSDYEVGEIPSVEIAQGALEYTYVLFKYNEDSGSMDIVAFMRGYA